MRKDFSGGFNILLLLIQQPRTDRPPSGAKPAMSWDVEPAMSPPSGALSSSCRACYPGR